MQSKAEIQRTRYAFRKDIFGTDVPTTFILLDTLLPAPVDPAKIDGQDIALENDLKKYYEQVETGMKWANRIIELGSKIAAAEVGKAFDAIAEGIQDFIVGEEMYLYLVDELTAEPVRANGWPLKITTPSDLVPKLIPSMMIGMRGLSICDGVAGLARMYGYPPVPKVPEALSKGAREIVELLKQDSLLEDFGVVHEQVKGGGEEHVSVFGPSLREFRNFLDLNDPGLKQSEGGDFAGMRQIGDPEGTALWTTLTDPADIENALKKRAEQREEQGKAPPLLRGKSLVGDHDKGEDLLGVLDEANAIADTIAFKDLQPPFVVGILGGWGSGKSFTYNLIKERLKEIQKYDLTDENVKKIFPYVGHIFSVWFDVWTYGKGSLWASLMFQILTDINDQLDLEATITNEHILQGVSVMELMDEFTTSGERKYLRNKVKDKRVQEAIRKWNPKGGNITQALVNAINSNYEEEVKTLAKKKKQLEKVTVMKKQQLAWKEVTAEKNTSILPEIKRLLKDAYKQYGEESADEEGFQTVEAVLNSMARWKTKYGRLKNFFDLSKAGRMSPLWVAVFLSSLIIAVAIPLVLKNIGAMAAAIGPALSGLYAKYEDAKKRLKSAQEEINKVASEMHLDKEQLQEALEAANKAQLRRDGIDEEKQQGLMQDLSAEINLLEDSIWLRKGDSLHRVVGDRVEENTYKEHLGVVHQAQEDLKRISDAMLSNKDNFPRGDPRIVLFIDDLDRCPPNKVVETLEAVQLLVKTKLFVVVLAIDAQYVTLCLEDKYKNILHPKRHPSGLDYIEKIIQLPYRVPPISDEYMEKFLQQQMNAKKKSTRSNSGHEELSDESKRATPEDDDQVTTEKTPLLLAFTGDEEAPTTTAQPEEHLVAIPIGELDFTWEELQLLKDACLLSGVSPRASRRLVNVFKTMKIIWYRRDEKPPDEETPYELKMKEACVCILALCASNSKQGMCEVLAKVEKIQSRPTGCDNLKSLFESALEKSGVVQVDNNLLIMISDERCSRILEEVVWKSDEEWNRAKRDLRLARCFTFVGEYSESVDDIRQPSSTGTKN